MHSMPSLQPVLASFHCLQRTASCTSGCVLNYVSFHDAGSSFEYTSWNDRTNNGTMN
jgi:hypothetical protein